MESSNSNKNKESAIQSKKRNFDLNELFNVSDRDIGKRHTNNKNKISTIETSKQSALDLDI